MTQLRVVAITYDYYPFDIRVRRMAEAAADAGYEMSVICLRDDGETPLLHIDPELERKQIGRLQAARARRDGAEVERTLSELRNAAATEANLMPLLLDCARAHATEGEMVEALQQVWGSYTEAPVF